MRVPENELEQMLAALPISDWESLRSRQVFIAGGTGFLGCWLLEVLLHANRQLGLGLSLAVLSRRPKLFAQKAPHLAGDAAVRLVEGDIRSGASLDVRCDLLVHAATDVEKPPEDSVDAFDAIVEGTRAAMALARNAGAARVLHVSSGAVYGVQPPQLPRIPEDHPIAPGGSAPGAAYAWGKRVSEWLADQSARSGALTVVHARVFALIGPYMPLNAHFAAGNFLADAAAGRCVHVAGNGSPFRSYLYGADAAAWLIRLLLRGEPSTPYNVGSEESISISDLARCIAEMAGVSVEIADRRPQRGAAARYVPDTRRAREGLGLLQYTDLPTALARSLQWARRMHAAGSIAAAGCP